MLARKYYKYKEVAEQLGCSYDDLEDYVYYQYIIRPCVHYKGFVVDASHKSGSKPNLIELNGDFEVDLSSLFSMKMVISGVGIEDSNVHYIKQLYHENRLVRLVHFTKNISSSKYGFSNVTDNNVRFSYQLKDLLFLKETIDKLTFELNNETQVTNIPPKNVQSTNTFDTADRLDEIEKCKKTVKSQGFARREQLAILTGKSPQTLANKASQNPNSSGWDKDHNYYSVADIKKFYGIDLM